VGLKVGVTVGATVGLMEGTMDGARVNLKEVEVGDLDGFTVLVKVGAAVGTFAMQPMKSTEQTPLLPN